MTRAESDGFTDLDLSMFTATNRHATLPISGGLKIRITNGTLTKADDLVGPILEITEGSQVIVAEDATIGDWYGNRNGAPVSSR